MLRYLETTTLILVWCFGLSLIWAVLSFVFVASRPRRLPRLTLGAGVVAPALVVAPLALLGAFRVAGINLLFPVHLLASAGDLVAAAIAPATVLVAASGIAGSLSRQVAREYAHWRGQAFATVALATGQKPSVVLRRLVLAKALCQAWSQCLPWLFGELIIVETVFNAPGLGLDAWHLARVRDFDGLLSTVAWLAALYGGCVLLTALLSRRLGRRLESYG